MGHCLAGMNVTVTVENGSPHTHRLRSRAAEIAAWLVEQADSISKCEKGQIQIDYYGDDLVMKNTQITEHRRKRERR